MSDVIDQPLADPTPEPAPEPVVPDPTPAAPADPEAEFDAAVEASAIDVPDGDRLVPLSAVTRLREKLREAKSGSQEAATLKQQLEEREAQLREDAPLAHAFRAMQQAQPQHVQTPAAPPAPVEDVAELEDIAKTFDFYRGDGNLDLDKARKVQSMTDKRAEARAQDQVRPWAEHTIQERANYNIARARATVLNGHSADEQILNGYIERVRKSPGGINTLADEEGMKHLWIAAFGASEAAKAMRGDSGVPAALPPPPAATVAVPTERSGGAHTVQPKALSASEKRAAKEAGMSEKQYLEAASKMPW